MFIQTYLILSFACVCFSAEFDVIWDQNYCENKDRYPSSYELPHSSPCALCINDVITLRINSPSDHYENIYRVYTEEQMMSCNATVNYNDGATFFTDMHTIDIQNAGSNQAFTFQFQLEPYYFISTSDGTLSSAQTDLSQPPNSCLQFAFRVKLDTDPNCGNFKADCTYSTVFEDPASTLFCQTNTTSTAHITTATMMPTSTTTILTVLNTTSTIPFQTTTTATVLSTTTTTTKSMEPKGLAIIFYVYTTDSPGAIAGLSVLLVICILMIFIITLSGIIFLVLYWYGKINFFDKKYFFQNTKLSEEKISRSSYREATGKIELGDIGYPMAAQVNEQPGSSDLSEPAYMNL